MSNRPPAIPPACTAGSPYGAIRRKVSRSAVDGPSMMGYLCPQRHWTVVKTPEESNISWRNRTASAGPIWSTLAGRIADVMKMGKIMIAH